MYNLSRTIKQLPIFYKYSRGIKSICINTTNKYQLLSFHLGGRICLWDYEDGLLLKVTFYDFLFQIFSNLILNFLFRLSRQN